MSIDPSSASPLSRRQFLQRSFAFSASSLLATGCGGSIHSAASSATTDSVVGGEAHFLMVGDWGEAGEPNDQGRVAYAMQQYVKRWNIETDALLMLGDNFYGSLHGGSASMRFQTQFESMYPESVFDCPALVVPGNHDYEISPMAKYPAELQYAANNVTRWTMPAQSYRRVFPETNPIVTFLALDSNMPNEPAQPLPTGHFYTMTDAQRLAQLEWLESELQAPLTTPHLVVIGHHPLFSNGPHGDNHTLIRDWGPLFQQYNVALYLAGHDHDLQHLEIEGQSTSFVMSGGGGAALYPLNSSKADRGPYAAELFGFTHLQIKPDELIVRHLNTDGKLLHKFTRDLSGKVTIASQGAA